MQLRSADEGSTVFYEVSPRYLLSLHCALKRGRIPVSDVISVLIAGTSILKTTRISRF